MPSVKVDVVAWVGVIKTYFPNSEIYLRHLNLEAMCFSGLYCKKDISGTF